MKQLLTTFLCFDRTNSVYSTDSLLKKLARALLGGMIHMFGGFALHASK